jgi:hypothetical protein
MSALTPYLCVSDSRAAIEWYREVFQATVRGTPYVMDDGRIGHVELEIGDALLMMADPFPEVDVEPPQPSNGSAVSLHLQWRTATLLPRWRYGKEPAWTAAPSPVATADPPLFATRLGIVGWSTPDVRWASHAGLRASVARARRAEEERAEALFLCERRRSRRVQARDARAAPLSTVRPRE